MDNLTEQLRTKLRQLRDENQQLSDANQQLLQLRDENQQLRDENQQLREDQGALAEQLEQKVVEVSEAREMEALYSTRFEHPLVRLTKIGN